MCDPKCLSVVGEEFSTLLLKDPMESCVTFLHHCVLDCLRVLEVWGSVVI